MADHETLSGAPLLETVPLVMSDGGATAAVGATPSMTSVTETLRVSVGLVPVTTSGYTPDAAPAPIASWMVVELLPLTRLAVGWKVGVTDSRWTR